MNRQTACAALIAMTLAGSPVESAEPAPNQGKYLFEGRWRLESVDDDAFSERALAGTARVRFGYKTPELKGFGALLEVQGTAALFLDDFNSTANGKSNYPVVADPNSYGVNRLFATYRLDDAGLLTLGRQYVVIDNQRFFGNSAWRQNGQTFDGFNAAYRVGKSVNLRYDYLNRVQRVFGDQNPTPDLRDWDVNLNLFHADIALGPGVLAGYAYLNENETLPLTSQKNFGVRYTAGKSAPDGLGWSAALEYAKQDSYADGADIIDADYALLEGALLWRGNQFKAGWEQLGGDGQWGFQTPYASLHAFNGWADRFGKTPVNGLRDTYLGWNRKFGKFNATVVWHDFNADFGGQHYGSEWDASLGWAFAPKWQALAKLADYSADSYLVDTTKLWLSVEYIY